jgi:hypothetical protein
VLLLDLDMYDPNSSSLIPAPRPTSSPLLHTCALTALLIIHPSYIIVLQLGNKFLREKGFKHVRFLSADGALESYPPVSLLPLHLFSFCFPCDPLPFFASCIYFKFDCPNSEGYPFLFPNST